MLLQTSKRQVFVLSSENHDTFLGNSSKLLKACKHKADILYVVSLNVKLHIYFFPYIERAF